MRQIERTATKGNLVVFEKRTADATQRTQLQQAGQRRAGTHMQAQIKIHLHTDVSLLTKIPSK